MGGVHHSTCRYYRDRVYNPAFWYLQAVLCLFFILPLALAGGLKKVPYRFPDFSHMLCVFVVSNAVKSVDVDRLRINCFIYSTPLELWGCGWWHLLPPVAPIVIHVQPFSGLQGCVAVGG